MAHGVTHYVLDGAVQKLAVTAHDCQILHFGKERATLAVDLDAGIVSDVGDDFLQVNFIVEVSGHPSIEPSQCKELANKRIHARRVALNSFRKLGTAIRLLLHKVGRRLQPCQRRTQFVGNIVKQAALRFNKILKTSSHVIEIFSQISKLVVAPPHGGTDTGLQSAGGYRFEGIAKITDRPGEIPCHDRREYQAYQ